VIYGSRMMNEHENVGGIPVTAEQIGFLPEEMIACGKCAKANPPNRLNCFYCGEALELPAEAAASVRFRHAEIEDWEPGVNLIVTSGLNGLDPKTIASTISIEEELLGDASDLKSPIPLFRVKAEEAGTAEARLVRLGLEVCRVDDTALTLSTPPTRLKGIQLSEDSITFHPFNSETSTAVAKSDVVLVVVGSIVTTTAESKVKKTRKEYKEFDDYTASSDHVIIDIHTSADIVGYRILSHGFDFSVLGEDKSLIAGDNVKKLIERLAEYMPTAVIDRSYVSKSAILDHVWPRTIANTSKGIERNWFGVQRATGITTSNESQFTRYSRVHRILI
jgi:hypothetical protein